MLMALSVTGLTQIMVLLFRHFSPFFGQFSPFLTKIPADQAGDDLLSRDFARLRFRRPKILYKRDLGVKNDENGAD